MRRMRLLLLGLLVCCPAVGLAQPSDTSAQPTQADVLDDVTAPSSSALETINRILDEDRDALEEESISGYSDGGRRDPFRSLLAKKNRPDTLGPRPPGKRGLLIDDLSLKGVFVTPQGAIAQVQASDSTTSYLLRTGDKLYDGEVLAIRFQKDDIAEIVFNQGVNDASSVRPFREVVKKIAP